MDIKCICFVIMMLIIVKLKEYQNHLFETTCGYAWQSEGQSQCDGCTVSVAH